LAYGQQAKSSYIQTRATFPGNQTSVTSPVPVSGKRKELCQTGRALRKKPQERAIGFGGYIGCRENLIHWIRYHAHLEPLVAVAD